MKQKHFDLPFIPAYYYFNFEFKKQLYYCSFKQILNEH